MKGMRLGSILGGGGGGASDFNYGLMEELSRTAITFIVQHMLEPIILDPTDIR